MKKENKFTLAMEDIGKKNIEEIGICVLIYIDDFYQAFNFSYNICPPFLPIGDTRFLTNKNCQCPIVEADKQNRELKYGKIISITYYFLNIKHQKSIMRNIPSKTNFQHSNEERYEFTHYMERSNGYPNYDHY